MSVKDTIKNYFEFEFMGDVSELSLNMWLDTNSDEVLARAFDQFKSNAEHRHKLSSFENNITWAKEYFEAKNKKSKKTHPTKFMSEEEREELYHPVAKGVLKEYKEKAAKISEKVKGVNDFYKQLSVEGKKVVIDAFIDDLFQNGWVRAAWQATREAHHHLFVENSKRDPRDNEYKIYEGKALTHVYQRYIEQNLDELHQYSMREEIKFNSFEYYEEEFNKRVEGINGKRNLV